MNFQLNNQYVSPTFSSLGYIILKALEIRYQNPSYNGEDHKKQKRKNLLFQILNYQGKLHESKKFNQEKVSQKEKILLQMMPKKKIMKSSWGIYLFQTIYIIKYTNKMTGKCSKLIMEGFYADGEVSLASHTSSPFRSMACLNHRAS